MTSKKKQPAKMKSPSTQKAQKDTIYVDVNDDITSLINSVKKSSSNIVAIVLPKNAQVLQSVVNMKLLKRSAVKNKKSIALITSDTSIQTIAGIASVHVAETANSKPFIPEVSIEDVDIDDNNPVVDMASEDGTDESNSTVEDEDIVSFKADDTEKTATIAKVKDKNKKFKIPDFGSFQTKLFLGIGGFITLLILWFIGFVVMPKATITVQTNTQSVPLQDTVTLVYDEDAAVDVESRQLPAKEVTTEKTSEASEQATGEKNVGDKATGTVTMSAQVCGAISSPSAVPSGTGVSSNGNTYITQEDSSFTFSSFDGACLNFSGETVPIVAQESGEKFNISEGSSFSVSGRSDVTASGGASGGTTEIVTVVSEEDIENAKRSLGDTARGEALQELKQKLEEDGLTAMDVTLTIEDPSYSISPKAGEEADSVSVKQTIMYSLSGYRAEDMTAIIDAVLAETLSGQDESKNVNDNGSGSVTFTETGENTFDFSTIATIGPSLDTNALAEEFAGKKRGEIVDQLESIDGVVSAEVTYSPMWITTTPKSAKKITIEVQSQ